MIQNKGIVLGIVGGIGSGKSLVSQIIEKEYKAYYINADKIGHEQLKKGSPSCDKIVEAFGSNIIDDEGNIDRKKLSNIVFSKEEKLIKLNKIVHPIMKHEIKKKIDGIATLKVYDYIVLEAALLIEANWIDLVDLVLYVYCDLEVRVNRLKDKRNMSKEKAYSVIEKQMTDKELRTYGDYIIDNSFDVDSTNNKVREIINQINVKEQLL